MKETASYLRSLVLEKVPAELSDPLTAASLNKGQSTTPQALLDFFLQLYSGNNDVTGQVERLAQSTSNDVVNNM